MTEKEIIAKLKRLSNPKAVEGMARFGINPKYTLGVSIPNLRSMAKDIGIEHDLAKKLWSTKIHEARILAGMIADHCQTDESLMDKWVQDFDSWDVCDEVIMNLFEKTPLAYKKAVEWSRKNEEYVKRAGYVLMARLAVSDKTAEDIAFVNFFPHIKRGSTDERNFVKKAVNWAIRQIGKRNLKLNQKAIKLSEEVLKIDSKSAKWIAGDALRELKDSKVLNRLKK